MLICCNFSRLFPTLAKAEPHVCCVVVFEKLLASKDVRKKGVKEWLIVPVMGMNQHAVDVENLAVAMVLFFLFLPRRSKTWKQVQYIKKRLHEKKQFLQEAGREMLSFFSFM